ncbi:MAG: hypothetical protein AB7S36_23920, partial [Planctomycetota bacterium]
GVELSPISDYITSSSSAHRVDQRKLFERFGDDASAMRALEQPKLNISDFLYERNIRPEELSRYRIRSVTRRGASPTDRLLPFARSGAPDRPYVPGSTLKGSLMSGLIWMINAEARDPENPLWVSGRFRDLLAECRRGRFPMDTPMVDALLGRESHNRLGRVLQVTDVPGDNDQLQLTHACLFHQATPRGGHEWSGRGRKARDSRDAAVLFMETLAPGSRLPVQVRFDEFLLREARRRRSPIDFSQEALDKEWLSPSYLLSGVMDLAYNTLWQEKQYFERCGHDRLVERTAELFARCEKLAENEVMLRLGWGISWHGVTGYLWDDMTAKALSLPQFDKAAYPFPKSRRVVFDGENPMGTPGWAIFRVKGTRHLPDES